MRYGHALTLTLLGLLALIIGCNSMQTSSAILRFQQGEFDMADSLCREALKVNPNDGEAYFYMALSQSNLLNYKDAYVNFKKAAELKPDRAEQAQSNIESNFANVFNDGVEAYEREDNESAIEFFRQSTEANPENPLGYNNLAKSYWAKAERFIDVSQDEFLEYAELALENMQTGLNMETDPEKKRGTATLMARVLGTLYVNDKEGREQHLTRYREFTADIEPHFAPHEEFAAMLYDEADALRNQKRQVAKELNIYSGEAYGKAADIRRDLGETDPNIPLLAGVAYMHADMYEESARYLEMSTQLDPNYDQAWLFLEFSHFSAKNYDEAIKAGRFLQESLQSTEPRVFRILANSYRAKAEACDEVGDEPCFQENKRLYEDSYITYATYAGLEDITPPELLSKREQEIKERRESAIFEQDGIAILSARVSGKFVRGTVLNKTGERVAFLEISLDLKDELGEVVGSTIAELEGLAPEREVNFRAAFIESDVTGFEITGLYIE